MVSGVRRFRARSPNLALRSEFFTGTAAPQSLALIGGIALAAYICYRLAMPFLSPLAWALCLTVLLLPLHKRVEGLIKPASVAASVSVLVAGLIVVAPGVFIAQRLVSETFVGAESIRTQITNGGIRTVLASHPRLLPIATFVEERLELPQILDKATSWLTSATASLVRNSAIEAVRLVLTFYFLFYFLRDYRTALNAIKSLVPFPSADMDKLFQNIADAIHATVYGTVVVSAIQGALGGLMFWWLGLPAPLFWGFVMALLAIIPIFGAFVIWIPAAISLALHGNWDKAVILTLWGAVVIGGIDNWIYPMLVGSRMKLHTILTFCATVGGVIAFGPSGIIVGPVVMTIMIFLLNAWKSRAVDQPAL
jgi:predicted PurR-regulated permease PerM